MKKQGEARTVLIIEDEEDIRIFASRVLELEGYRVVSTSSGEEGLKTARSTPVSLVLLDLKLPGLDGWEVLKWLKKDPRLAAIPVVMFTASAAVPQQEQAQKLGAQAYLTKPLSAASLKEHVSRILEEGGP